MQPIFRLWISLALCAAAAGASSACQPMHASRLVLAAEQAGGARIVLTPQWPRKLLLTPLRTRVDVEHLVVTLSRLVSGTPTEVARVDLDRAHLSQSVSFTQLRANSTYRIQGLAYKAAGEDPQDLISTQDASSYLDVAVTTDDRPTLATLRVQLTDVPPLLVTTFAGTGQGGPWDGWAMAAQFDEPTGIALDPAGNIFVVDAGGCRIRKITPDGLVSTFAGSSYGYADGTGPTAKFTRPTSVAIDGAGNLYVADSYNHRIRKISPAGVVTTLAGGPEGFVDGTGTAARFRYPQGVAVDGSGNVFVADTNNHCIRKITPAGVVTTLAGSGLSGFTDGTGTAAQFANPSGVAVDGSGNVYVADSENGCIRKVSPAGVVTTLAGSAGGFGDLVDGTGPEAQFDWPTSLTLDATGNLYVADTGNYHIRKVSPAGVVTTLAGDRLGYADGAVTEADFDWPSGLAFDAAGSLYVADTGNYRIRKIQ